MNMKVVMIDDDPDDQMFYGRLFKEENDSLLFEAYSSVDDFLTHYQNNDKLPNLIILDLNMPRISGLEFIKTKADCSNYNGVPIIVLTTSSSPLDMQDCKEHDVHSYFIKPLNYEDCKSLVNTIYGYWLKFNNLTNQS